MDELTGSKGQALLRLAGVPRGPGGDSAVRLTAKTYKESDLQLKHTMSQTHS